VLQDLQSLTGLRRAELGTLGREQPTGERNRHVPVDDKPCTLSKLAQDLGALNCPLDPRSPAARELEVEQVAETAQ
jgi:hypothetical protein